MASVIDASERVTSKLCFSLKNLFDGAQLVPMRKKDRMRQMADKVPNNPLIVINPRGSMSKVVKNNPLRILLIGWLINLKR